MVVGDYVRTIRGISKIENIIYKYDYIFCKTDNELGNCTYSSNGVGYYFHKEDKDKIILKSSPNIIDLIEVGDYVNGNKIVYIQEEEFPNYPKRLLFAGVDENNIDDVWEVYNNDNIKSIVTKEQFENIQYEVE